MNVRDPLWSKATATKQQMKSETGIIGSYAAYHLRQSLLNANIIDHQ